MANLEMRLGEMTQPVLVGQGMHHGANHADWKLRTVGSDRTPAAAARPLKKRGGCKTCDGIGCVGRCRF
jgi:hypothetical protein